MPVYQGADGASLSYDVLGAAPAPALIVLAGGAARDPVYLGDLAGLSQRYRLIVPHLRGVGRSVKAPVGDQASWWGQAADIDRLREHLGLDRCLVAGHSAGARLALAYAAQFPARLAALVLITLPAAAYVDVPPDTPELIAARMGEPVFAAAVAASEAGPDLSGPDLSRDDSFNAWQQAIAPLCFAAWDETARAHAALGRYHLAAAQAFLSAPPPADLRARLAEVTVPVLAIAGAEDVIAGVRPIVSLVASIETSEVCVLDHCGHVPWVERPAAFRAVVDPFLAASSGKDR